MSTSDWKTCQEEAAQVLRSAGMVATTDTKVHGARAAHDVDVVGVGEFAGVKVEWLIECKRLKRPATKAHVLTFQQVVADVGADRGLLLSESGFQAGAIAAARRTNLRLTSLEELADELSDAIGSSELKTLWWRIRACQERYWEFDKPTRIEHGLRPDVGQVVGYRSLSVIRIVEEGVVQALTSSFPIDWSNSIDARMFPEVALAATNVMELSRHFEPHVADLERRLDELHSM
ncbi:restriction endonuclease [Actinomycetospora termitidis]|uniref:Restriction endonuclease n=1 Tax=Actinomycetospora termitidis TaxID=3053470 RepID=A0ABT7MG26_9PSEU|nr:restriction endonuclease [Actinomycetospora sp. Odt1-22]MDL5159624.1 restriction endonuclease [Actinomycetospora sp. Odt1-22]